MRLPERRFTLAILIVLLTVSLVACGPDVEHSLPNGYKLLVLNSNDVTIVSPVGQVVKYSVGRLGVRNDLVFGEIVDPDSGEVQEYFILNTAGSKVQYFESLNAWQTALGAEKVADRTLYRPTALFGVQKDLAKNWPFYAFSGSGLIVIGFLCCISIRKKHRERT